MTHRRRLHLSLVLLVALAVAGVGVVVWSAGPKHRIKRETCDKIQFGMARGEVEDLLGVPAGNHASGGAQAVYSSPAPFLGQERPGLRLVGIVTQPSSEWVGEDCAITIWFDEQGRVLLTMAGTVPRPPNVLDKLRRWLGL